MMKTERESTKVNKIETNKAERREERKEEITRTSILRMWQEERSERRQSRDM